jgi:hypothetical protein
MTGGVQSWGKGNSTHLNTSLISDRIVAKFFTGFSLPKKIVMVTRIRWSVVNLPTSFI